MQFETPFNERGRKTSARSPGADIGQLNRMALTTFETISGALAPMQFEGALLSIRANSVGAILLALLDKDREKWIYRKAKEYHERDQSNVL